MASTLAPVTENKSTFSIERILGLGLERLEKGWKCFKLHRPWAEIEAGNSNTNCFCCKQQHNPHRHHHPQQMTSQRPISKWYIGRRPRTAFTSSQVNVLEGVFKVNCYPGIQLREQLAGRLDLEEDRIQIWFQNRRAKLRRSFKETQLQLVQSTVVDPRVRHQVTSQPKPMRDVQGDLQLPCHLQLHLMEEEEDSY